MSLSKKVDEMLVPESFRKKKMNRSLMLIFFTLLITAANAYSDDEVFSAPRTEYLSNNARNAVEATIFHLEEYVQCLTKSEDNRICSADNRKRDGREIKYLLKLEIGLLKNYRSVFNKAFEKKKVELSDSRAEMKGGAIAAFIHLHAIANLLSNKCAKKSERNLFKDSGVEIYIKFSEEKDKILLSKQITPAYILFNKKEMEIEKEQVFGDVCGEDFRTVMYVLTNANKLLLEKIETDKDVALMQFMAAYVASLSILLEKTS